MDNTAYTPNSHKAKSEAKKPEKFSGRVRVRKRGKAAKLGEVFGLEDIHNVRRYAVQDVLIPMVKKGVFEIFKMAIYPDGRSDRRRDGDRPSYDRFYSDRRSEDRSYRRESRRRERYNDYVFDTKADAEDVINRLMDLAEAQDGVASVSDLNYILDIGGAYTENNYGWTLRDLRNAQSVRVFDGYILDLPRPRYLK